MRRSLRIVAMAVNKKDTETEKSLNLPFYETTKGTSQDDRNTAILRGFYFNTSTPDKKNKISQISIDDSLPNIELEPHTEATTVDLLSKPTIDECKSPVNEDSIDDSLPNIEFEPHTEATTVDLLSKPTIDECKSPVNEDSIDDSLPNIEFEPHTEATTVDLLSKPTIDECKSPVNEDNNLSDDVYESSSESYVPSISEDSDDHIAENEKATVSNAKSRSKIKARARIMTVPQKCNDFEGVALPEVKKHENGKLIRNKLHCCYFCNKLLTNNMARHFERVHGKESNVGEILALPKNSKLRRNKFENLIRIGDFYYNCNVLAVKEGELILVRRPENSGFTYKDFVPCATCLGFFSKTYLWHHMKFGCSIKKTNRQESNRGPQQEGAALLFQLSRQNFSETFMTEVVSAFRIDEISEVCKNDDTILKFGEFMFERYGTTQTELIRQTMRQVGRFKIQLLKHCPNIISMSMALRPANFDNIVIAVKELCVIFPTTDQRIGFKTPSLALKLGHHLRKCIAIERGAALRTGNLSRSDELQNLLSLFDLEWLNRISSNALATLSRNKMNTKQLLPLTSDLLKLNIFLKTQSEILQNELLNSCSTKSWSKFASILLSRIILFNKRRSGEAARMTLENYSSRPSWEDEGVQEFKDNLTEVEKQLVNRLTVIQIIGKRGRIVPVILTNDIKKKLDILNKSRIKAEISSSNPYVFARSIQSQKGTHLRGHDCLRSCCLEAGLAHATNITSTKLRKYVATVCQIFDLKENECDWLARHLGHDIRVHRNFYRMHESAVELTKVSRLLLAVDSGKATQFAGKSLDDINVEDLPDIDVEEGDASDDDNDFLNNKNIDINNVEENADINNIEENAFDTDVPSDFPEINIQKERPMEFRNKKKNNGRKPWSSEELNFALTYFQKDIKKGKLPGKQACTECINKAGNVLKGRQWTHLKFAIKNHLSRLNRQKK